MYDALGNIPNQVLSATLTDATLADSSNALLPGTRELVRFLAWHKPSPGTPKERNDNWEGVGRIFWGFYDPRKFSKRHNPRR